MAAESASKSPGPGTFDPEALLAAQRRNVEAFTDAGKIVADGMRRYAEGQVGLMQEAMRDLWGAVQTGGGPPAVTNPSDQLARMRAAFERALAQVQELTRLLLKVQGDALAVLNEAAAANAQALGGAAPHLAEMQKAVIEAMQDASRQVTAAVDEMRRRMGDLQEETRRAARGTGAAPR